MDNRADPAQVTPDQPRRGRPRRGPAHRPAGTANPTGGAPPTRSGWTGLAAAAAVLAVAIGGGLTLGLTVFGGDDHAPEGTQTAPSPTRSFPFPVFTLTHRANPSRPAALPPGWALGDAVGRALDGPTPTPPAATPPTAASWPAASWPTTTPAAGTPPAWAGVPPTPPAQPLVPTVPAAPGSAG